MNTLGAAHNSMILLTLSATLALFGCEKNPKPVCGDGKVEGTEACDGADLGGQTCQGLGHDGGELTCTDQCTLDDSACHDCGASDPCANRDCGPGEGTCRLYDCQPYCDCAEGYVTGSGLTCQPEDSCKVLGQACDNDFQCCHGLCSPTSDGSFVCAQLGCLDDFQCNYAGEDDREACCVEYPAGWPGVEPGDTYCGGTALGGTCGDKSGTCGAACDQGYYSDCTPGSTCSAYCEGDPYAHCGPPCETDADCTGCSSAHFPGMAFSCQSAGSGMKFCAPEWPACDTDADCLGDLVCTYYVAADNSMRQACRLGGYVPTGGYCTGDTEAYLASPFDQRCEGRWCWNNHCTRGCTSNQDCPAEMLCSYISQMDVSMCFWAPGSRAPCHHDADCDGDEVCILMNDEQGHQVAGCRAPECDPADDDCQAIGEPCGDAHPPCENGFCANGPEGLTCLQTCVANADCIPGMLCAGVPLADGTVQGVCTPVPGSGTGCDHNGDCPAGEACTYYQGLDGAQGVCTTSQGEGQIGEECVNSTDCETGMCFGQPGGGYCSGVCAQDDQCPQGLLCLAFTFAGNPDDVYSACQPFDGSADPCGRDEDCQDDEVCSFAMKASDNRLVWDFLCKAPNPQGQGAGTDCSNTGSCYNDMCFTDDAQVWCSSACLDDGDCPQSYYCSSHSNDIFGPTLTGICWPIAGSQQACTSDADCVANAEVCGFVFPLAAPPEGRCITPMADGAEPGEGCQHWDECAGRFCDVSRGLCATYCQTNADCDSYGLVCKSYLWPVQWLIGFQVELTGCIPPDEFGALCSRCESDSECGQDAKCIASQANPGEHYCGLPCPNGDECPQGSSCTDVGGGVDNCVPDSDTCVPD